ncbi:MAG TPA: lamin tail domain-containing protein [Kofleriaceae bacterium]
MGLSLTAIGCDPEPGTDGAEATAPSPLVSPDIVISQLYGGGGNSGASFTNDYVELFNRGASSVTITGWSVQYASSTGSAWAAASLSGTIPAGGYYLVRLASNGSVGANLPVADATGSMNMSGSTGKVALVTNQTLLTCGASACLPDSSIRDLVGYGSANQSEGSPAPTQSNTTAGFRGGHGCTDSDNNAADFATGAPAPRNSSSARAACSGGGGGGGGADAGVPDGGTTPPDGGSSGDGTPTRLPCTSTFGSAMTAAYGRLDGFLVAIVNPNTTTSCRGDDNHIHLQVQVNGRVEDIAVNIASTSGNPNVDFRTLTAPLRGGAWSEGWHTGQQLDYVNHLGVSSGSFTERTPTQLTSLVDSALASANHVSIFATGFDATGGHLIHRNPTNHDGAIVINPLSANPQYLLFHFATQSF